MTGARTIEMSGALHGSDAERAKRLATYAAVAVAGVLVAVKVWAWLATDSVALFASLVDSALDLLASGLNAFAVHTALVPADREHRFGHGKAEAIAGLGQAAFIAASAAFVVYESVQRLLQPQAVEQSALGIGVMVVSIVLTLGLVLFQRSVIRRTHSLAIGADSLHYAGDLAMNLGVIAALALAGFFGWTLADPLIGIVIAGFIAWSAVKIMRGSLDELMDREFDEADRDRIKQIVAKHADVVNMHDLRTRRSGHHAFIQLHLELPPAIPLIDAHRISDEVEDALRLAFPDAEVLIHQDPAGVERPLVFPRT